MPADLSARAGSGALVDAERASAWRHFLGVGGDAAVVAARARYAALRDEALPDVTAVDSSSDPLSGLLGDDGPAPGDDVWAKSRGRAETAFRHVRTEDGAGRPTPQKMMAPAVQRRKHHPKRSSSLRARSTQVPRQRRAPRAGITRRLRGAASLRAARSGRGPEHLGDMLASFESGPRRRGRYRSSCARRSTRTWSD